MDVENPYPYGSGEHLAFAVQQNFGDKEASFCLWVMSRYVDGNVVTFLTDILDRFGVGVAAYLAKYLQNFETLPNVSPETKQRVVLAFLDFDVDNDPDLKRFED